MPSLQSNSGEAQFDFFNFPRTQSKKSRFILLSVILNLTLIYIIVSLFISSKLTSLTLNAIPKYQIDKTRPLIDLNSTNFNELSPIDFGNASAIFNTIHGALKQKNSNLNPIGVSYIPAYVPDGTLLYHSNHDGKIPKTFEWLAMDYEFSYNFAFDRRGKRLHGPSREKEGNFPGRPKHGLDRNGPASLMTFRVAKPLSKLVYLDGASAAKTSTGEMDTQLLLSRSTDDGERVDERDFAEKICNWGRSFGMDGFVRLEIGFEIVLCDFSEKLTLISNVTLSNVTGFIDFPNEPTEENEPNLLETERSKLLDIYGGMSGYEHLKAGELVNDREYRIQLDFSKIVTAINRTYLNPDPYERRISNISTDLKEEIIHDVAESLAYDNNPTAGTDWQMVANHIVDKFSPMFSVLNNSFTRFKEASNDEIMLETIYLTRNISSVTYNFVRRYVDSPTIDDELKLQDAMNMSIYDYAHNFAPITTKSDLLIASSVFKIQSEISGLLFKYFKLSKTVLGIIYIDEALDDLMSYRDEFLKLGEELESFIESLRWSVFYGCPSGCQWNELCYIPTWGPSPLGWGASLGTYFDGSRSRISKDCLCISYETLMSQN